MILRPGKYYRVDTKEKFKDLLEMAEKQNLSWLFANDEPKSISENLKLWNDYAENTVVEVGKSMLDILDMDDLMFFDKDELIDYEISILLPGRIYELNTESKFKFVMAQAEKEGLEFNSGVKPTRKIWNKNHTHGENTLLEISKIQDGAKLTFMNKFDRQFYDPSEVITLGENPYEKTKIEKEIEEIVEISYLIEVLDETVYKVTEKDFIDFINRHPGEIKIVHKVKSDQVYYSLKMGGSNKLHKFGTKDEVFKIISEMIGPTTVEISEIKMESVREDR